VNVEDGKLRTEERAYEVKPTRCPFNRVDKHDEALTDGDRAVAG